MQNTANPFVLDDSDEGVPPLPNQNPLQPNTVWLYSHPLHLWDDNHTIPEDDDDESHRDDDESVAGSARIASRRTSVAQQGQASTQSNFDIEEEYLTADAFNKRIENLDGRLWCFPPQSTSACILEYQECAPAKDFLSAVETHGQLELPTAPEEMSSERLTTGVWVQGKFAADNKPENEKSALFVAIPYLGEVLYDSENPESIRLSDFDGIAAGGAAGATPPGSPATPPELAVHQARFIVYNNTTIATFKSKESMKRIRQSVFPGDTQGAFHLLSRMISNVVTSDQKIIANYRRNLLSNQGLVRLQSMTAEALRPAGVGRSNAGDLERLLTKISEDLECLILTMSVIKRQVEVVDDLIMNFKNSCTVDEDLIIRMPVISNNKEQIIAALPVLKWASDRRGKVLNDLKEIFQPLKMAYDHAVQLIATAIMSPSQSLPVPPSQMGPQATGSEADMLAGLRGFTERLTELQNEDASARRNLLHHVMLIQQATTNIANVNEAERAKATAESLRDLLIQISNSSQFTAQTQHELWKSQEARMAQQAADADLLRHEIAWQGEQMSMFVAVTTVFLPLAFFTQYFAMDSAKDSAKTQGRFWLITLPITIAFIVGVIFMIFKKNHDNDEIAKCFRSIRYLGRIHDSKKVGFYKPKTRAEVRKKKDEEDAGRKLLDAQQAFERTRKENEEKGMERQLELEQQRQREEAKKRASIWSIGNGSVASASATTTVPGITATRMIMPTMVGGEDPTASGNEKMVVKVSAEDDVVKVSAESDSMMLTVSAGASPRMKSSATVGDETAAPSDTRGSQ